MSRTIPLLLGAVIALLALAAVYTWLADGRESLPIPRLGPGAATAAGSAMIGLLAGFVGAVIANLFNIGRRGHDKRLAQRIAALESAKDRAQTRAATSPSPPPAPSAAADRPEPGRTGPPYFRYDRPGHEPQQPQPRQDPTGPAPAEPAKAPEPPPPEPRRELRVPNLDAISSAYSRIVSGQISRSAFAEFFDGIGRSGPVEIADGGSGIEPTDSESFLTCVNAGETYLVFPSYDFIANQATQFATIASVPDNVAAIFALQRGDGELILDRPALYEESETGPQLVSKGEIRGFGG